MLDSQETNSYAPNCHLQQQRQGKASPNEHRAWFVIGLTTVVMVIEIISGFVFGSMALLADGWHMASHAAALSITAIAYYFARRLSSNPRFSFGTGKIGELAGYSSAILLLLIALLVAYESFHRFVAPVQISFDQAIFVAIIGLAVNIVSAFILKEKPHAHQHGHHHHQHDNNIRAAYLHVLADALTSILAIVALITGRFWNWVWMDPMMGIVGAVVITRWSIQLLRDSGKILLDVTPDEAVIERIRTVIDSNSDSYVSDLHLWQVGPNQFSAIVAINTMGRQTPDDYKKQIAGICELQHITIEINPESPV